MLLFVIAGAIVAVAPCFMSSTRGRRPRPTVQNARLSLEHHWLDVCPIARSNRRAYKAAGAVISAHCGTISDALSLCLQLHDLLRARLRAALAHRPPRLPTASAGPVALSSRYTATVGLRDWTAVDIWAYVRGPAGSVSSLPTIRLCTYGPLAAGCLSGDARALLSSTSACSRPRRIPVNRPGDLPPSRR